MTVGALRLCPARLLQELGHAVVLFCLLLLFAFAWTTMGCYYCIASELAAVTSSEGNRRPGLIWPVPIVQLNPDAHFPSW